MLTSPPDSFCARSFLPVLPFRAQLFRHFRDKVRKPRGGFRLPIHHKNLRVWQRLMKFTYKERYQVSAASEHSVSGNWFFLKLDLRSKI